MEPLSLVYHQNTLGTLGSPSIRSTSVNPTPQNKSIMQHTILPYIYDNIQHLPKHMG
jgi:hypothetical protein